LAKSNAISHNGDPGPAQATGIGDKLLSPSYRPRGETKPSPSPQKKILILYVNRPKFTIVERTIFVTRMTFAFEFPIRSYLCSVADIRNVLIFFDFCNISGGGLLKKKKLKKKENIP